MLEKWFRFSEHKTTVPTEIMAGLATFLTAVYILAVNPQILSATGMPPDALFTATAISMIIGTMLMGLYANMPFILAPGMGINIYFAFALVVGKQYTWQEALTAVLLSGILFVLASFIGLREALLKGFPEPLKHAMTVSLGLMIAAIGLKNSGILVFNEGFVSLGKVTTGAPLLAMIGILLTGLFITLRVRAAVLLGIIGTTVIGGFMGVTDYQVLMDKGFVTMPPSVAPIAMAFSWDASRILTMDFAVVILTLLAIDLFDSLGTFVGVLNHFDGEERRRYDAQIPRALMADAVATIAGACLGTSTVTTYVESSTGVAAGGRTGLTAVTIGVLLIAALFASPLFLMVPAAATTPALVVVGMYMMAMAKRIDFGDASEGLPAVIMVMITAFTLSISDGLMFGWLGFVALKLLAGKLKDLNLTIVLVGLFFLLRLFLL